MLAGLVGSVLTSGINNMLSRDAKDYEQGLAKDLMQYQFQNFMSPYAQAMSYAKAGISPSQAFGAGGPGQLATPQPSYSPSPISFVSGVGEIANAVQAMAQAKKAGAETVAQQLENDITQQTFSEKVRAVALQNKWTEEQTANIVQQTSRIVGECNVMQKQVEKLESEKKLTDKEVEWYSRHMKAEIEHLKQSAEYSRAMAGLTNSQKELLDRSLDDLVGINNLNYQQLEKVVELLNSYGDAEKIVGLIGQVIGSASDLIGAVAGFRRSSFPVISEKSQTRTEGKRIVTTNTKYGYRD